MSSLVFTQKPTLSMRKLKLREVKSVAQGDPTGMLGSKFFFIPKLLHPGEPLRGHSG